MTFLPIVARELRIAARRKSTYWIRSATAFIGLIIAFGAGLIAALESMMAFALRVSPGEYIFNALSFYLFGICLLAGVVLAADCLSEERREGTLGFLFLTDLKGYDIVLGKLMAVGLNAFYGLLATFPILGISLLAGGVSGAEFWRMSLALTNALWFSIAATLWISACSESAQRSTINSIILLLLVVVGGPVLSAFPIGNLGRHLCFVSPSEAFFFAHQADYIRHGADFWWALLVSNVMGWLFLALASWRLPRSLETTVTRPETGFWRRLLTGDLLAGRKQRIAELLEINPILWLLDDSRQFRWIVWGVVIVGSTVMFICSAAGSPGAIFTTYSSRPFFFLLKVLFAIQSCRFFTEARRTGTLELLCTTPTSKKSIVDGQWLALNRMFRWPVIVMISAELLAILLALFHGENSLIALGMTGFASSLLAAYEIATTVADFFALGWLGMWLALSSKKPQLATGLTVLFVLILPTVFQCVPSLLVDGVFIIIFRSKLEREFRAVVP